MFAAIKKELGGGGGGGCCYVPVYRKHISFFAFSLFGKQFLDLDHILMARILRPKSLPPLAPYAKDISLIIRKRNRITKETGYYIFENLESLIKHNKLNGEFCI